MLFLGSLCVIAAFAFVAGFVWAPLLWVVFSVCALVYGFFDETPTDVG